MKSRLLISALAAALGAPGGADARALRSKRGRGFDVAPAQVAEKMTAIESEWSDQVTLFVACQAQNRGEECDKVPAHFTPACVAVADGLVKMIGGSDNERPQYFKEVCTKMERDDDKKACGGFSDSLVRTMNDYASSAFASSPDYDGMCTGLFLDWVCQATGADKHCAAAEQYKANHARKVEAEEQMVDVMPPNQTATSAAATSAAAASAATAATPAATGPAASASPDAMPPPDIPPDNRDPQAVAATQSPSPPSALPVAAPAAAATTLAPTAPAAPAAAPNVALAASKGKATAGRKKHKDWGAMMRAMLAKRQAEFAARRAAAFAIPKEAPKDEEEPGSKALKKVLEAEQKRAQAISAKKPVVAEAAPVLSKARPHSAKAEIAHPAGKPSLVKVAKPSSAKAAKPSSANAAKPRSAKVAKPAVAKSSGNSKHIDAGDQMLKDLEKMSENLGKNRITKTHHLFGLMPAKAYGDD